MNCKASVTTDAVVLDRDEILDRVGGDESLLREVAGIFLTECPDLIEDIRTAIDSRDPKRLERSAHTLKGAVSNFGARAATQAAFQLEHLGRQNRFDGVGEAMDRLEEQLAQLRLALLDLIES